MPRHSDDAAATVADHLAPPLAAPCGATGGLRHRHSLRIYRLRARKRAGGGAGSCSRVRRYAGVPIFGATRRLQRRRRRQIAILGPIIEKIITFVLSF